MFVDFANKYVDFKAFVFRILVFFKKKLFVSFAFTSFLFFPPPVLFSPANHVTTICASFNVGYVVYFCVFLQ